MSQQETSIEQARAYIERYGYQTEVRADGRLIVQDPVARCGLGAQAGRLIPAGFESVTVRSFSGAVRFILARHIESDV